MKLTHCFILFAVALSLFSCGDSTNWQDIEKELQEQLLLAGDGAVIEIPAGHYKFKGSLSLEGVNNVTIKGAGKDKTILSFKGQTEGAEGLKIVNADNLTLDGFTIQDTDGDAVKVQECDQVVFRNVRTQWTGGPHEDNGSYGFYPVRCSNVLIEGCEAIGASDAGIYVGQSKHVIVRKSKASYNVAGIEIENTLYADVYENEASDNTGGILVFDMPGLTQSGGYVRVFNNKMLHNNTRNFAPEGNIVGTVPPGSGFFMVATCNVEVFDNEFIGNKTMGAAIVSFKNAGREWKDSTFNPYSKGVYIYDNKFDRGWGLPILSSDVAWALAARFWFSPPDIIFDGDIDPSALDTDGKMLPKFRICLKNNGDATFINADVPNKFKNIDTDISHYTCEHPLLEPVTLNEK